MAAAYIFFSCFGRMFALFSIPPITKQSPIQFQLIAVDRFECDREMTFQMFMFTTYCWISCRAEPSRIVKWKQSGMIIDYPTVNPLRGVVPTINDSSLFHQSYSLPAGAIPSTTTFFSPIDPQGVAYGYLQHNCEIPAHRSLKLFNLQHGVADVARALLLPKYQENYFEMLSLMKDYFSWTDSTWVKHNTVSLIAGALQITNRMPPFWEMPPSWASTGIRDWLYNKDIGMNPAVKQRIAEAANREKHAIYHALEVPFSDRQAFDPQPSSQTQRKRDLLSIVMEILLSDVKRFQGQGIEFYNEWCEIAYPWIDGVHNGVEIVLCRPNDIFDPYSCNMKDLRTPEEKAKHQSQSPHIQNLFEMYRPVFQQRMNLTGEAFSRWRQRFDSTFFSL